MCMFSGIQLIHLSFQLLASRGLLQVLKSDDLFGFRKCFCCLYSCSMLDPFGKAAFITSTDLPASEVQKSSIFVL